MIFLVIYFTISHLVKKEKFLGNIELLYRQVIISLHIVALYENRENLYCSCNTG